MTLPDDISSHAPLLDRLRGKAFLPGVHYVTQAATWMHEAADTIEAVTELLREVMVDNQVGEGCDALDTCACSAARAWRLINGVEEPK